MQQPVADRGASTAEVQVRSLDAHGDERRRDVIAVEEPLEIRIATGRAAKRAQRSVSVTMRTPGHDFELAVGFLFTEGIVTAAGQVQAVDFCGPAPPGKVQSNIVRVDLRPEVVVDLARLQRNFFSTSSCGICGKASLDALDMEGCPLLDPERPRIPAGLVHALPGRLREAQAVFDRTGGLHAAGLFDVSGALVLCREDVGRHNAVDKVIGAQVLAGLTPLSDHVLVVSGRVSFEILQKALAGGIPVVVAVGAPSSLAVETAERFGFTLIGFARDGRYNVYAGEQRLEREGASEC